jgi:hypothetical protein
VQLCPARLCPLSHACPSPVKLQMMCSPSDTHRPAVSATQRGCGAAQVGWSSWLRNVALWGLSLAISLLASYCEVYKLMELIATWVMTNYSLSTRGPMVIFGWNTGMPQPGVPPHHPCCFVGCSVGISHGSKRVVPAVEVQLCAR